MSQTKLWGGRFTKTTASHVEAYTQSISWDHQLYSADIKGSLAHAQMLGRQGILTASEVKQIEQGLMQIRQEIESNNFPWQPELEDVHMNIESRLTDLIGEAGKKLHTGRSRNDQVALDFRLFVGECTGHWLKLTKQLIAAFVTQAKAQTGIILPGYTHLQPAQPVSLTQHLLAYAWMFKRDAERLAQSLQRINISPLGAAALAGTTYPLDSASVAQELGLGLFANSMDAVSDRDFVLEPLFNASVIMMHLSRFCEELILWANPNFGFIKLPDAYATGSSIMPQKKNPDVAEIMRGKVGRTYGNLMALLTILKGLPLTYNRDLQEDKEPFLDTHKTVQASVSIMTEMLLALEFRPEKMRQALSAGYLNATELADYLVGLGFAFREAHHITGALVAKAESLGKGLEDLPLNLMQELCPQIKADVYELLDYATAVSRRTTPGGTGWESGKQQIKDLEQYLATKTAECACK